MSVDIKDRERCPLCGRRLEWRTVQVNPYLNEWVPWCPCGFGEPPEGVGT